MERERVEMEREWGWRESGDEERGDGGKVEMDDLTCMVMQSVLLLPPSLTG